MSVTITFEKKHFLMAGIIIALPFMILAISSIFAATTMPLVGHPISELFVDADLDMNNNKITNISEPVMDNDAATKGYIDNIIVATSDPTYKVFSKCTSCNRQASSCSPPDESAPECPIGTTEVYFAKHDTDFSTLGYLYTNPMTVVDNTLSASHVNPSSNCGPVTANVVDVNGSILTSATAITSGSYSCSPTCASYCYVWCSYRICQQN